MSHADRAERAILHLGVIARYERGEAHVDIARALGISVALSSRICREAGYRKLEGTTPRTPAERARARLERDHRVVELHRAGRTHVEIAAKLGLSRSHVGGILRAAGYRKADR